MRLFSRLAIIWLILLNILPNIFTPTTFAQQQPDAFLVQIDPSNFDLNTPVDVTVKAVKANGEVIKDYQGDVFIDINGSLDTTDYTVPSEWLYTFVAQDQWVKTFSKGLIIKKAGTYTVTVSDITNDTIKWEKSVIVWSQSASASVKKITITSPIKSSVQTNEVLEVLWTATELPNSPLELYLNGQIGYQGTTASDGSFTAYLTGLIKGDNTLEAKILDVNGTVLGESDTVTFSFDSATDWTFNSIQVLPSNTVKAGTKTTFKVATSDTVTSVTLNLSNGRTAPMNLDSAGSFSKDIMIDTEGKIDVSLDLMVAGQKKSYSKVTSLIIEKGSKIGKVRVFSDSAYKNKVTLTWEVEGSDPAKYNVVFGTQQDLLNQSATVVKKEIVLEDLEVGKTYYFKIVPLDADGQQLGWSSDVVQATIGDDTEAACTVQGIHIDDVQIGDSHYLVRSGIQNVEKYVIYRSDWETTDITKMQKVWETTDTRYEYPYIKKSKQEKYSYYAVQAICTDGKAIVMQDIKKVKTWPVENVLLFVFVTLFLYSSYRLYLYNKS